MSLQCRTNTLSQIRNAISLPLLSLTSFVIYMKNFRRDETTRDDSSSLRLQEGRNGCTGLRRESSSCLVFPNRGILLESVFLCRSSLLLRMEFTCSCKYFLSSDLPENCAFQPQFVSDSKQFYSHHSSSALTIL
jgi:hypothetical protein